MPFKFAMGLSAAALAVGLAAAAEDAPGKSPAAPPAAGNKGIILVAFGTTSDTGAKAYQTLERALAARVPGVPVRVAYTSRMVRERLAAKGVPSLSVEEAMRLLAWKDGASRVAVQSLHVVPGEEFHEMAREAKASAGRCGVARVAVGRPLLVSRSDLERLCDALVASLPKERAPDDAVLFMGHGQADGRCDMAYLAAAAALARRDPKIALATVEGGLGFDDALEALRRAGAKTVWLAPFLVVAGDHALNDLAGDGPDSWKSRLAKEGFVCRPHLVGMGEIPGVAALFGAHLEAAVKELDR